MMKRILAASAALVSVAAMASTASAITVAPTSTFNITGNVTPLCNTGALPTGSTTVPLGVLNKPDGTFDTSKLTVGLTDLGTMWCNGAHSTVEVTATPITTPATGFPSTFTNRIDYSLSATFGGAPIGSISTLGTTLADTGVKTVGIFSGDVQASATAVSDTHILVAGPYTGQVTVTVTPGV